MGSSLCHPKNHYRLRWRGDHRTRCFVHRSKKCGLPSTLTVYAARTVSCWVTRCRCGVRDEQGQVLPYESMEEEQNGLELVFKGVTVEMLLQEPDDYESYGVVPTQGQWDIVRERSRQLPRTLSILVTVPDLDEMEIGLKLELGEGLDREPIFQDSYIKTENQGILSNRIYESNNDPRISKTVDIKKIKNSYLLSYEQHIQSNQPPRLLSLFVSFTDSKTPTEENNGTFKIMV